MAWPFSMHIFAPGNSADQADFVVLQFGVGSALPTDSNSPGVTDVGVGILIDRIVQMKFMQFVKASDLATIGLLEAHYQNKLLYSVQLHVDSTDNDGRTPKSQATVFFQNVIVDFIKPRIKAGKVPAPQNGLGASIDLQIDLVKIAADNVKIIYQVPRLGEGVSAVEI